MKYHQLTKSERYQIEAGLALGLSVKDLSSRIGRHRSTIFRELKRNGHLSREGYSADYSQVQYEARRTKCRKVKVVRGEVKRWVDLKLNLQWSPEQIAGRRKLENLSRVGRETIYRYIYRDKLLGGNLWKNLRHCREKRKRRFSRVRWSSAEPRRPIELRPVAAEKRKRFGDFERDLIVGTKRTGYLLTIVDRKTRLTLLHPLKTATAKNVHRATVTLLRDLKVRTLTNDNGMEFTDHVETSQALRAKIYFTNPYSAWERGTVENTNKLVRQYFPKKQSLKEVSLENIKMVEARINNRPRKLLGYKTPLEMCS